MRVVGLSLAMLATVPAFPLHPTSHPAHVFPIRRSIGTPLRASLTMNARCDEYAARLSSNKGRWGGRFIGPVVRYLNICLVGLIFGLVMRFLNRFRAIRRKDFLQHVFRRPKGRGLLTVSNHLSVADDPGLWAALLPWWRMRPEQMRWSLCTDGVFFANPIIAKVIGAGNVMPLDRMGSLEQPLFKCFLDKLNGGSWTHLFAEGRVWQEWRFDENEQRLGPFKVGVGKLVAHSMNDPLVVPMYHKGLDKVIPEKVLTAKRSRKASVPISLIPRVGKNIELYVGHPVSFRNKLEAFDEKHGSEMRRSWQSTPELLQLYAEITNDIREQVLLLEAEAWRRNSTVSC